MTELRKIYINGVDYESGQSGVDSSTETLQVIDYPHHEIHSGSHYFICGFQDFSNGEVVDFTVVTPNTTKWLHMLFQIEGSGAVSIEIYEDATVDVAGTVTTPNNNNRNSANTSDAVIRTGDTFTDIGTLKFGNQSGANKAAGIIGRENEIILKQNSTYIFRITNQTAITNVIYFCGEWYEHINKN